MATQFLCKVGIFGGSFDPPHRGHGEIIRQMLGSCEAVHLQVTIDPINRAKGNPSPYTRRCQWLQWLLEDAGIEGNWQINHLEYEKGLSGYSIHFLRAMKELHGSSLGFFVGKDQIETLNEWVGFPHFLQYAQFFCFKRAGEDIHWHNGIKDYRDQIVTLDWEIPSISSTEIRKNPEKYGEYLTPRVLKAIKGP